jgi:hypothetical protein
VTRLGAAIVITTMVVWVGTCAAAVVSKDLIPLAGLATPVMTAVVGGYFTSLYLATRKDDDES